MLFVHRLLKRPLLIIKSLKKTIRSSLLKCFHDLKGRKGEHREPCTASESFCMELGTMARACNCSTLGD